MPNRNLTTIGMVGLLLIGLAIAAWFLLRDPGKQSAAPNLTNTPAPVIADTGTNTSRASDKPSVNTSPTPDKQPDQPDPLPKVEPLPDDPTPEATPLTRTMKVTGRVVLQESGRAAVGATVRAETAPMPLWHGDRENYIHLPRPTFAGEVVTDGSGAFTLEFTLTHGDAAQVAFEDLFVVVARLPQYAPGRSGLLRTSSDADELSSILISLTYPTAVRGRVVDSADKQGISGATVEFWLATDTGGVAAPRHFPTNMDGYFECADLAAGEYTLTISAKGYVDLIGWSDSSGRRDLSRGGETDLGDFVLRKAGGLTGLVLGPDGKIAQAVAVQADLGGRDRHWTSQSESTDASGRFTFEGLSPGVYTLQLHKSGVGMLTVSDVMVESGQVKDLGELRLNAGLTLSVKVTDAAGKPVPEAEVGVQNPERSGLYYEFHSEAGWDLTPDDGMCRIAGLKPGELRLWVAKDGYARHWQILQLSADQEVVVVLAAGGGIRGRLVNADGSPAGTCLAWALPYASKELEQYRKQGPDGLYDVTRSDSSGEFTVQHLAAGEYLLALIGDNGRAEVDPVVVTAGQDTDVGDVRMPAGGGLRVLLTENGAPVPEQRISVSAYSGWHSAINGVTDNAGMAVFTNLPPGEYYISTSRDSADFDPNDSRRRRVRVVSNETAELQVELSVRVGLSISGRATLSGRAEFKEVTLVGQDDLRSVVKDTRVAEGGFYEFQSLKPGRYRLHFRVDAGHMTFIGQVTLGDENALHDFDFSAVRLSGTVSVPAGKEGLRASVRVQLMALEAGEQVYIGWLSGRASCDAEGLFAFSAVAPGRYRLAAVLDGVGIAEQTVIVREEDITDLGLQLSDGGTLRITLAKLSGEIDGLKVVQAQLIDADGNVLLAALGSGTIVLPSNAPTEVSMIPPGTYTVWVRGAQCLTREYPGIQIKKGEVTELSIEVVVGATLALTVQNSEVTQEMLDLARVRYFDSAGKEVPRDSNIWDAWSAPPTGDKPTVVTRYISPSVKEVRVRVTGYAEAVVPVTFEAGKTIAAEVTLERE